MWGNVGYVKSKVTGWEELTWRKGQSCPAGVMMGCDWLEGWTYIYGGKADIRKPKQTWQWNWEVNAEGHWITALGFIWVEGFEVCQEKLWYSRSQADLGRRDGAKIQADRARAAQITTAKMGWTGMFRDMEASVRAKAEVKAVEQVACMYSICARSGGFLEKSWLTPLKNRYGKRK